MSFEQLIQELEKVVKQLEAGGSLDESIELFQRGLELSRECIASLNQSKGKISLLTDELNNLTEELKID
ncbi:MAG TPA: exodeoxyribonuclease VII small subunit [Eubacteriales bacterium]|jgi:exodeoxyribonuclease VII small subunit|nr:exodeoxyribonuclease VII small subunit [Clostridia bacterium]HRR89924.1 exodeoxyribonuclease VII small subunit [Eubacteriales bacterium]HRU84486.1 exodeoxyribonuclease VII small subunit [Eubacteriales bacterium]